MNCIIIEDEIDAVEGLEQKLTQVGYSIDVLARMDSIEEAVPWLENNTTDLIFLDIQLGDGLGFEIFDHIQLATPVIFTTSYDQYWERAFEVNSISYLLKPIDPEMLRKALDKYSFLNRNEKELKEKVLILNQERGGYQQRFLVKNGKTFLSVPFQDVAYFYIQNKTFLFVVTKSRQQFLYDSTLEQLEQRLDPGIFFRISRQCIVNFDSIRQLHHDDNNRRFILEVEPPAKEELIVSRYRIAEFKFWLNR